VRHRRIRDGEREDRGEEEEFHAVFFGAFFAAFFGWAAASASGSSRTNVVAVQVTAIV
jgi:hypothetical protein